MEACFGSRLVPGGAGRDQAAGKTVLDWPGRPYFPVAQLFLINFVQYHQ